MNKKKILLIGGSGFLGKWLIQSLSCNNYEISILDTKVKFKEIKKYNLKHCFKHSVENNKYLKKSLNMEDWDYIIWLAAWGGNGNGLLKAANENFRKAMLINVNSFKNFLDILKNKNNIKIIWSSSTVVFGEESFYQYKKVTESSKLSPTTNYGLTKVLAEEITKYYIKNYNMSITGIRFPIIIGPGLNYRGVASGISDMAISIIKRKKITIPIVSSSLDLIYIKDAVEIITKLLNTQSNLKNIYNCPSFRTNSKRLEESFNKNSGKYIIIKDLGEGATYPIMDPKVLNKDLKFKLQYNLKKSIKNWLKELKNLS